MKQAKTIDEAKQVSEAFGGNTWCHEGGKTYSVNTVWHVMTTEDWWLCDRDSEAEAIEAAKSCKSAKVVRATCVYLVANSGDPDDDELISVEHDVIWSR
nr:MAG TPA: hypothetical protein [Caudoviricetes sp.]